MGSSREQATINRRRLMLWQSGEALFPMELLTDVLVRVTMSHRLCSSIFVPLSLNPDLLKGLEAAVGSITSFLLQLASCNFLLL
jgi:hypothetical protein